MYFYEKLDQFPICLFYNVIDANVLRHSPMALKFIECVVVWYRSISSITSTILRYIFFVRNVGYILFSNEWCLSLRLACQNLCQNTYTLCGTCLCPGWENPTQITAINWPWQLKPKITLYERPWNIAGINTNKTNRKYKDYVYRKMLVQEYLKKWRIFKRVKPKNDMMYHDIYNCICQNTKK